jgi:hypothetical protein
MRELRSIFFNNAKMPICLGENCTNICWHSHCGSFVMLSIENFDKGGFGYGRESKREGNQGSDPMASLYGYHQMGTRHGPNDGGFLR